MISYVIRVPQTGPWEMQNISYGRGLIDIGASDSSRPLLEWLHVTKGVPDAVTRRKSDFQPHSRLVPGT